jgi:hypothetical protein
VRTLLRGVANGLRWLAGRPAKPPTSAPVPTAPATQASSHPGAQPVPAQRPPVRHLEGPPTGRHLAYAPNLDGRADPGEIVWLWVPYEDDPSQGKDRPVLVVGRDGSHLLGLMLSSQHTRDGQSNWYALGAGEWDKEKRPSWVRLDRVLSVPEAGIRREGAILDRKRFDAIATQLRASYGWA